MTPKCPRCDIPLDDDRACPEHNTIPTRRQGYLLGAALSLVIVLPLLVVFPPAGLVALLASPFAVWYVVRDWTV